MLAGLLSLYLALRLKGFITFLMGTCRNSFLVFVSDRSRSGLAENLGQIRFS